MQSHCWRFAKCQLQVDGIGVSGVGDISFLFPPLTLHNSLSGNKIGVEGCKAVSTALKNVNCKLTRLELVKNSCVFANVFLT